MMQLDNCWPTYQTVSFISITRKTCLLLKNFSELFFLLTFLVTFYFVLFLLWNIALQLVLSFDVYFILLCCIVRYLDKTIYFFKIPFYWDITIFQGMAGDWIFTVVPQYRYVDFLTETDCYSFFFRIYKVDRML